jgi:DNA mismatch endonuclease (patch repair protein)
MDRSANMRAIRSTGMKPEMTVRKMVHSAGYRFRLHRYDLPGRPDLVFPGRAKIVFVHGCYWHQHDDVRCKVTHKPKSNTHYWSPKLQRNKNRDAAHRESLKELGWNTLVVWECEVKRSPDKILKRIIKFLET